MNTGAVGINYKLDKTWCLRGFVAISTATPKRISFLLLASLQNHSKRGHPLKNRYTHLTELLWLSLWLSFKITPRLTLKGHPPRTLDQHAPKAPS